MSTREANCINKIFINIECKEKSERNAVTFTSGSLVNVNTGTGRSSAADGGAAAHLLNWAQPNSRNWKDATLQKVSTVHVL